MAYPCQEAKWMARRVEGTWREEVPSSLRPFVISISITLEIYRETWGPIFGVEVLRMASQVSQDIHTLWQIFLAPYWYEGWYYRLGKVGEINIARVCVLLYIGSMAHRPRVVPPPMPWGDVAFLVGHFCSLSIFRQWRLTTEFRR